MHITLAHVFEEFADVLVGSKVWVSWVTLDGWEPFGAGDCSTVIKSPAEQSPVVILHKKGKV